MNLMTSIIPQLNILQYAFEDFAIRQVALVRRHKLSWHVTFNVVQLLNKPQDVQTFTQRSLVG